MYLKNLDASLTSMPLKIQQYRLLKASFQTLEPAIWAEFKDEVLPLLTAKDPNRGWRALFDIPNHAKRLRLPKTIGLHEYRVHSAIRQEGATQSRFTSRSRERGSPM